MRAQVRIKCHASVLGLQLAPNIGQDKLYALRALACEQLA